MRTNLCTSIDDLRWVDPPMNEGLHMSSNQFCRRTRREFLWDSGAKFPALAMTGILAGDGFFNGANPPDVVMMSKTPASCSR